MKRFKINTDILLSAGGRHILYSPELADTVDPDNITELERDVEEAKFKAIVFLNQSDPVQYEDLNLELKSSKNLGRDKHPDPGANAMEIMVCRSGAFNTNLIGSGRSNFWVLVVAVEEAVEAIILPKKRGKIAEHQLVRFWCLVQTEGRAMLNILHVKVGVTVLTSVLNLQMKMTQILGVKKEVLFNLDAV